MALLVERESFTGRFTEHLAIGSDEAAREDWGRKCREIIGFQGGEIVRGNPG
jgi:hypothetical protein